MAAQDEPRPKANLDGELPQLLIVHEAGAEPREKALVFCGIAFIQVEGNDAAEQRIAHEFNGLIVHGAERHTARRPLGDDEGLRRVLGERGAFGSVHVGGVDAGLAKEGPVQRLVLDPELPQDAENLVIRNETVGEIPGVVDFGVGTFHYCSIVGCGLGREARRPTLHFARSLPHFIRALGRWRLPLRLPLLPRLPE